MRKVRVVGNPGTGKTTYLIDRVIEALEDGVEFDEILYLTFTKKAIKEALERIEKRFETDAEERKSFRTIHSLAFQGLGLSRGDILQDREYQTIALDLGISAANAKSYLSIYGWQQLTGKDPHKKLESLLEARSDASVPEYSEFIRRIKQHKHQTSKLDFNDILKLYSERVLMRPLKLLIVDEAQDLSASQWDVIRVLEKYVTDDGKYYFAGDPHQAIFGWAGASVDDFHSEVVTEQYILPQSYRVPMLVQQLSKTVLSYFTDPEMYPYDPKNEAGSVHHIGNRQYGKIPFMEEGTGDWLVLAHTWAQLVQVQEYLRKAGIPWRLSGKAAANGELKKKIQLVKWYVQLMNTGKVSDHAGKKLKEHLTTDIETCLIHQTPWPKAFGYFTPIEVEQIQGIFSTGGVTLSTIHAIKGGEADNVVILGDISRTIMKGFDHSMAESYMVLYVAITRCKNNLYLMDTGSQHGYNWTTLMEEAGICQ